MIGIFLHMRTVNIKYNSKFMHELHNVNIICMYIIDIAIFIHIRDI